jgi:hypothetical protein
LRFRRWDEGWILAQKLLDICVVEELIESIRIMVGANSCREYGGMQRAAEYE